MAFAYLNDGATSFAAANWSDATGVADAAELAVGEGGQSILSDLDHSTIGGGNEGLEALRISRQFRGIIGTGSSPLRVDIENSADAILRYEAAAGQMYYKAEGDDSTCNNLLVNSGGSMNVVGGTIVSLVVERGTCNVDENTVVTTAYLLGGRGTIEDNGTGFTNCYVNGGVWTIRRAGVYHIGEGASVTFDIDGGTVAANIYGGSVRVTRGTIQTYNQYAGRVDSTGLEREATWGATAGVIAGGSLSKNALLTIDAGVTYVGSQTEAQGNAPVSL
jgi:hypothetical protein